MMMSPGLSSSASLKSETIAGTSKIMSRVFPDWRSSPFYPGTNIELVGVGYFVLGYQPRPNGSGCNPLGPRQLQEVRMDGRVSTDKIARGQIIANHVAGDVVKTFAFAMFRPPRPMTTASS